MGLAEDLQRVRLRARGAEINARHRRAREKAERLNASRAPETPVDGLNPAFRAKLDAARERVRRAQEERDGGALPSPQDRIEQLRMEGKLPPRAGDPGVGYEPTAEEVLGELAQGQPSAPDGTEELADADAVLGGDVVYPPENGGSWGGPPPPAAPEPVHAGAGGPGGGAPLAGEPKAVHSKRKRGK